MNTGYESIQIKLDWDNIAFKEAERRIELIKKEGLVESINLRESATQKGYHAIVKTYHYIPVTARYRYRRMWKDDGFRLVGDIMNKSAYFRDVLFDYKKFGDLRLEATPMFLYKRDKQFSSKWHKIQLIIPKV